MRISRAVFLVVALAMLAAACGGSSSPSTVVPPCDQTCADKDAARAVREMMKLAYNRLLQGKPVGPQDASTPCPFGGSVHVAGTATSNAVQGATEVDLTYTFQACALVSVDTTPDQNYNVTLTAVCTQSGTLAVQPSSTTALNIACTAATISGTVHDPPVPFAADSCKVVFGQDGNRLSGTLCERPVGVDL